jgi:vitamin B12 transporter
MRYYLVLISYVFFAGTVSSQTEVDTIVSEHILPVMEVTASSASDSSWALIGQQEQRLLYGMLAGHDLGVLLDRSGAAFINVSGPPGASASARFAGFSSDHAVFFWNGVPINSLSLGTCDLSMVPGFFVDQAVLYRNSSVNEVPSGGLGMTLNLHSSRMVNNHGYMSIQSSMNSMRNSTLAAEQHHTLFDSKPGRKWRLTWRSRFLLQDLKNEFSYRDIYMAEGPLIAQQHNNARNMALMNDVLCNTKFGDFSFHHWLGARNTSLPAIMGRYAEGKAEQRDEINRSLLRWNLKRSNLDINVTGASFKERLLYRDLPLTNDQWLIHSDVHSSSYMFSSSLKYRFAQVFSLRLHSVMANQTVRNSNYAAGNAALNWWQLGGTIAFQPERWKMAIDVQQDSRVQSQGPSASVLFERHDDFQYFSLRSHLSVGRKYRAPDMNELYWSPGGNRDLMPESSYNFHSGSELRIDLSQRAAVSVLPSFQWANVTNWIQWIPTSMGYWMPVNLKEVESRVFELPLSLTASLGKYKIFSEARWMHTQSQLKDVMGEANKKMIYTPEHTYAGAIGLEAESLSVSLRYRYSAERYTDEMNTASRVLPAYDVAGMMIKYSAAIQRLSYNLCLDVDNVFDVRYESVRAYAIPGRVISLQLTCQLITTKTSKQHHE